MAESVSNNDFSNSVNLETEEGSQPFSNSLNLMENNINSQGTLLLTLLMWKLQCFIF